MGGGGFSLPQISVPKFEGPKIDLAPMNNFWSNPAGLVGAAVQSGINTMDNYLPGTKKVLDPGGVFNSLDKVGTNIRGAVLGQKPTTAAMSSQLQYDSNGRPIKPDFISNLDETKNLREQYRLGVDNRGIDAIRERALGTGPSAWAKIATERQGMEEQNLRNQAADQAAGALASARSNMAMRGGLSSGASERLAINSMNQAMKANQDIANKGMMARSDIGLQDQQTRDSFLKDLPSLQNTASAADQWNKQQALAGLTGENQFNMGNYAEQMKAWAAQKSADAMRDSGSGGNRGGLFGGSIWPGVL